jgi:hypothetical protein
VEDGEDFIGTIDDVFVGELGDDRILGIRLEDGQNGVNYNFTEWENNS